MPYSEGIYDDINQVISMQHYWNPAITANATVRSYIASQYSQKPEVIAAVLEAIALLEHVFPMGDPANPSKDGFPPYPLGPDGACYHYHCGCVAHCVASEGAPNRCDLALELLQKAEAMMTPQAKAGWRWRLLMDRAVIDAGMFSSRTPSAAVAAALADIAAIYHMQCPGRVISDCHFRKKSY